MDKLLIRPEEAADAIGVSRSRVYQMIASGEIPAVRIGSSVRVSPDALRAWVESKGRSRRPPAAAEQPIGAGAR